MNGKRYTQKELDEAVAKAIHEALAKKGLTPEDVATSRTEIDQMKADNERQRQELNGKIESLAADLKIPARLLRYGLQGPPKTPEGKPAGANNEKQEEH